MFLTDILFEKWIGFLDCFIWLWGQVLRKCIKTLNVEVCEAGREAGNGSGAQRFPGKGAHMKHVGATELRGPW